MESQLYSKIQIFLFLLNSISSCSYISDFNFCFKIFLITSESLSDIYELNSFLQSNCHLCIAYIQVILAKLSWRNVWVSFLWIFGNWDILENKIANVLLARDPITASKLLNLSRLLVLYYQARKLSNIGFSFHISFIQLSLISFPWFYKCTTLSRAEIRLIDRLRLQPHSLHTHFFKFNIVEFSKCLFLPSSFSISDTNYYPS